jgi:hypothetical protein
MLCSGVATCTSRVITSLTFICHLLLQRIFEPAGRSKIHASRARLARNVDAIRRSRIKLEDPIMARYGRTAQRKVRKAMHERKRGTLRSGRSRKRVKSRKQAIAIGLSQARRSGAKVPRRRRKK